MIDSLKKQQTTKSKNTNHIREHGWTVDPLIVITAGAIGTTHAPSMKQIITTFQLPETTIKHTFDAINTFAIHYVGSILLHKRRIENNQAIPIE